MAWCEKNVKASSLVNVLGTTKLLKRLSERGMSGVYLSSSHVFDGELPNCDVDEITSAKNQYGMQKCEVENFIIKNDLPFAILRLGKVMGLKRPDRFNDWIKKIQQNEPITVLSDVNFSPVLASDVAQILIKLADAKVKGVWHLTAKDQVSYAEAINTLVGKLSINAPLISPVESVNIGLSQNFIQNHTALECGKLRDIFDHKCYTSEEILERIAGQYMLQGVQICKLAQALRLR